MKPEEQRSGPGLPALSYHGFQVVPLPVPHEPVAHLHPASSAVPRALRPLELVPRASPGTALPLPAL